MEGKLPFTVLKFWRVCGWDYYHRSGSGRITFILSQGGNLFWRFIPFYVTVRSEVMSELHRIYSYPHDLANLWDRLEDLKYNNVNWNRCMWGSPNLNQRFSSPGASYDDQSSTQIKRGMSTAHTSQQTESTTQQHFAGISNNALNCVS